MDQTAGIYPVIIRPKPVSMWFTGALVILIVGMLYFILTSHTFLHFILPLIAGILLLLFLILIIIASRTALHFTETGMTYHQLFDGVQLEYTDITRVGIRKDETGSRYGNLTIYQLQIESDSAGTTSIPLKGWLHPDILTILNTLSTHLPTDALDPQVEQLIQLGGNVSLLK